jgi:hypothetical protein
LLGAFLPGVFFVIFVPVLAFGFVVVDFAAGFLDSLGFVVFFGSLGFVACFGSWASSPSSVLWTWAARFSLAQVRVPCLPLS